jgi:hypothetical protein
MSGVKREKSTLYYRISRLKKGMLEDRATSITGKPDRVEKRGEYVVFRYKDRLTITDYPVYSYDRLDYYVIVKNGLVVDYGRGEIRLVLPPPEEKCNTRLGTIGVVPALFLPEAEVDAPGEDWAKDGARVAEKYADGVLRAGDPCAFIIAPCAAGIGCLVGIPQGQIRAVPDDEVEEMRAVITNAIVEFNIQETISAYVSKTSLELTDCDFDLLKGEGPTSPDEELNYSFLKGDGIDYVLEVSVRNVGFKSGPGRNPDTFFFMTVHYRFVRTGDEKEIFSKDFYWISDQYHLRLADYVDNDSRLLQEEFDRACRKASERIAKRLLYE